PMAHFRPFYTNSSSLSYGFPPRTVLMGLIAGILGLDRDTYYEEFSCMNCKIALSLRSSFRKILQRVNYVQTDEEKYVNLSGGRTQIPLEILLPPAGKEFLVYRIYFYHPAFQQKLLELLKDKKVFYPPYLGLSEFLATVELQDLIDGKNIIEKEGNNECIELATVVPVHLLPEGGLCFEEGKQYIKEFMPVEFSPDRKARTANFLYEKSTGLLRAKIRGCYYEIYYRCGLEEGEITENIVFLE
ncbi:MAG: CRISPR-associated protein Cas5, partial [bacterium]